MTTPLNPGSTPTAAPPVTDESTWRAALADLRRREKAATRELDAIAAQRRRLPMVEMDDYVLAAPQAAHGAAARIHPDRR